MREPYERLIMTVIGYKAIELAAQRQKSANSEMVRLAEDELKIPDRHEPDDPDDSCRKTAAIRIIENKREFAESLPLYPDFMW